MYNKYCIQRINSLFILETIFFFFLILKINIMEFRSYKKRLKKIFSNMSKITIQRNIKGEIQMKSNAKIAIVTDNSFINDKLFNETAVSVLSNY